MDKIEVINQLKCFEFLRVLSINIDISEFEEIYLECKSNYSKLCDKCIELEILELPYDCLSKPKYCLKKQSDLDIIRLYEKLKFRKK